MTEREGSYDDLSKQKFWRWKLHKLRFLEIITTILYSYTPEYNTAVYKAIWQKQTSTCYRMCVCNTVWGGLGEHWDEYCLSVLGKEAYVVPRKRASLLTANTESPLYWCAFRVLKDVRKLENNSLWTLKPDLWRGESVIKYWMVTSH